MQYGARPFISFPQSNHTYFAQTDLAMTPRMSSSDSPSRHQKGV